MGGAIIEVSELTKKFGELTAVDHVSFEVFEGEIFGFLGPNGAGKTTTINMLTTVQRPTGGNARVNGHDVADDALEVRRSIGLVPQEYTADEDLTGLENLLLVARLYDIPRVESRKRSGELLRLVQLEDAANRPVETYSGGMRRRLELACGLINRPRVMFLDEPTLGLDVQTRAAVWEYIRLLKEQYNMTIFMTTHYLEEADQLCSRVAIIDHGKIVALDSPGNLKASLGGDIIDIAVIGGSGDALATALQAIPSVRELRRVDGGYRLTVLNGEETAPLVLDTIRGQNQKATRISIAKPTLDEVYLARTGRTMREEEGSRDQFFRQRLTMRRARP
ncbi:MAG TPA: ATP-binding cassette domain-containing protein [Thermoplasmata archaeon]|jgi:ABC-2 type transport system ATP-binding protein